MTETYLYVARRLDGTRSSGVLRAESWQTAANELMERRLTLLFLDRHRSVRSLLRPSERFRAVHEKSRRSFYRALGTLLTAGCSFSRSLDICIARADSPALADALHSILACVRMGRTLSDAFEGMPRDFPASDVAFIRAGEKMGSVDATLLRLAEALEKKGDLRERIVAAIAYPAWVFITSVSIMAILAATTLPSVVSLLKELGAPPSGLLAFSILVANRLEHPSAWAWLASIALLGIVGIAAVRYRPRVVKLREAALLRIPILGNIVADRFGGEFFSTTGELLGAGVGVIEAIALGAAATQNQTFIATAETWLSRIKGGETWSSSMVEGPFVDRFTKTMIELGEESGALPRLLGAIGAQRLAEAGNRLRLLTSFVEPAALLLVGSLVAIFVSGVLIPIYNAIGGIR